MSKFEHLKKLSPSADKEVPYPLVQIEGEPVLIMVQATEANKKYYNALLKKNSMSIRRLRSQRFNAGMLAENRNTDRDLFPKFIIKNWEKVVDADGVDVPFTVEDARDFILALPDHIFDDVRNFASDPVNFVDEPLDEEATSGN